MDKKYISNLNQDEKEILIKKGTEKPYTGIYDDFFDTGIYICKACERGLYLSDCKFASGCGWPSFDNEISGAIKRKQDLSHERVREEILCSHCEGHLGHIFEGENYTKNNIRHCVNSLSIKFVPFNKNWKNKVDIIADKYIISKNQLLLFLKKSDQ